MSEQSIISNIGSTLSDVKARIKQEGIGGIIKDTLIANQQALESWYQKVLEQKGFLNEQEKQQLSDQLESARKKVLESSYKQGKKRTIIILSISLVVLGGIAFYIFKKRNKQ